MKLGNTDWSLDDDGFGDLVRVPAAVRGEAMVITGSCCYEGELTLHGVHDLVRRVGGGRGRSFARHPPWPAAMEGEIWVVGK